MAQDFFEQLHNAVKQAESRGQRYDEKGNLLTSPKGAQGEMQVMPKTSMDPGFGVAPAKGGTPDEIARVGRDYLKAMVDKYGDTQKALMAYNWGPGNTDKWLASGADPKKVPAETQKYVSDITGMLGGKKTRVAEASNVQDLVKDAGPGYKAAMAMMFLADDKPKTDDDDIWKEAEAPVEEETAQPSALAELDLSYQSPFPTQKQVPVQRFAEGGMPYAPTIGIKGTAREELDKIKADYDAYNAKVDAYNKQGTDYGNSFYKENGQMIIAQKNANTRSQRVNPYIYYTANDKGELSAAYKPTQDLSKAVYTAAPDAAGYFMVRTADIAAPGAAPTAPAVTTEQLQAKADVAKADAKARQTAVNVAFDPASYGLSMNRLFAHGGIVHRADGSPMGGENADHLTPQEIERMAAAQAPAFVTPSSGRGRTAGPISQALNSGTAYPAIMRGVGDVAYDITGAPVDIANMVVKASPMISRYAPEKPFFGSDWLKEQATSLGIRPGEETDPTLKGFRTAGELGASLMNPAAPVRAIAQTKSADMLRRAFAPSAEAQAAAAKAAHRERVAEAEEIMRRAVPVQIDLPFPTTPPAIVERAQTLAPAAPTVPSALPQQVMAPVAPPVIQEAAASVAIGETVQPFVGRLDTFVSSLKGPVTKEQFLNQLKGKFRDYDLQRAETVLSDLGAADKITPAQLTERLSANFSPRDFRIAVHSPEENQYGSFFQGMDNPFIGHKGKNMGVIALLQNNTPERIAAHESNLKVETALSNLTSNPTLGAFMYSDKDVPVVLQYLENNPQAVSNPKEAKAALEKAQKYFQIALDRQNEIKSVVSAYKYPATHPNWSGYVDEAAAAARASGDSSYHFQLMDRANQRVWDEANQWLKKHKIKPPSEEMLTSSGYSDLNKYLENKLDPLLKEAQVARNKVVNYVKPYTQEIDAFQKQQQLYGGDPVHSPLTKQIGHYDPVSFSRFTEHKLPMDDGTEVKGIFLHELQSDRMDDLVKKGPKGGSREKDLAELAKIKEGMQNIRAASAGMEPNLAVDAHIMDQAVRIAKLSKEDKTDAARHLYNSYPDKRETITEAFKLANRENELTRRSYSGQYSLPESFAGMETNKAATQQLMLKTAITAAMQRGDNFVAFPVTYGAGKSAQAQLYERLPYNLKQVVKDMGGEKMGFYTKQVKLPIDDATDATTTAVFWGPATRDHVMKTGVPFAKGGSVERVSDDNRRYL